MHNMNNPSLKFAQSFNRAVTREENIQSNGAVNWNFVDADTYEDMQPIDGEQHYITFTQLADAYEAANGKQHQL